MGLQSVGMLNVSLQGLKRFLVRFPLAHRQEYHRTDLRNDYLCLPESCLLPNLVVKLLPQ